FLSELVRVYPRRSGKGIRPALLLAACQAYGGSVADGIRPAVALELLHNAFLIHDDLEDESASRRGAPALHVTHGLPLAVNAGDALAARALEPLLDGDALGGRLVRRVVREFVTTVHTTTEGQALELGWRRDNVVDLGPADYLRMAIRKTCWYTTVSPLRLGALIGSRGRAPLDALSHFGSYLGVAFQIRDDVLSTTSRANSNGKEVLGDIREGKRTLMLIHLLSEAKPDERGWLVEFLGAPAASRTEAQAECVLHLMQGYGSIDFARSYAEAMATAACESFEATFADAGEPSSVRFIRDLIPYMVSRSN
ncbi:MAG: polyprenyl synthetase family protein, partial [Solirubrobacterales bacterium]|nr:polyprenyl synthetase family protein [Solirubrobacterales bacterium]